MNKEERRASRIWRKHAFLFSEPDGQDSGCCSYFFPGFAHSPEEKDASDIQFGSHGNPGADDAKSFKQKHGQWNPHAPDGDEIQNSRPESIPFASQNSSDNFCNRCQKIHENRSADKHQDAGTGHGANPHPDNSPAKIMGQAFSVRSNALSNRGLSLIELNSVFYYSSFISAGFFSHQRYLVRGGETLVKAEKDNIAIHLCVRVDKARMDFGFGKRDEERR